jgi:toxin-antitoxin system PIN domain toxin
MTRYLLDVNVLIALFDPAHANHEAAHDWFARTGSSAWATCPITENGFVRVVSHSRYPTVEASPAEALEHLRAFTGNHPGYEFWPASVSLTDNSLFSPAFLTSSGHVTDAYLMGLAAKQGGKLATFDQGMNCSWIKASGPPVLELISG